MLSGRLRAPGLCSVVLIAFTISLSQGTNVRARSYTTDSLYNVPAAPVAAFVWFPKLPHIGEPVTFVSTSTDLVSPITGYGWDVGDVGAFADGGPTMKTSFSTPADRVVRLQITASDGLSSVASETIRVAQPAPIVMYPFPIIRIKGVDFRNGTRVSALAVRAVAGAVISVACRGPGCRVRRQSRVVEARSTRPLWLTFPDFERFLHPGASLTVRVSKAPLIGAYTTFRVRRRTLPARIDACLDPAGIRPIVCPS